MLNSKNDVKTAYLKYWIWCFNTFNILKWCWRCKRLRHKGRVDQKTKAQKNHINCSEMLNAIQKRKRCNRLVIIPWQNTIPFQELIEDHFGVDVKRNGDHSRADLRIISGAVHILLIVHTLYILHLLLTSAPLCAMKLVPHASKSQC